jgi:hypothetical protein
MLRILLFKDLRRAGRNPLPWLIHLLVPLLMTGLLGMAFGPKSESKGLGRIRFALVDEDDSPVSGMIRGASNQRDAGNYLEPVVLDRDEALRQIKVNQVCAAVIIPKGFAENYLTTTQTVTLELVKNPAQSVHPAVMEEMLGVLVTALDVAKRHLGSELPDWRAAFQDDIDYLRVAELVTRDGAKIQAARKYISPPLIVYTKQSESNDKPLPGKARDAAASGGKAGAAKGSAAPAVNVFGFLLPGLASMFLLFLASNAVVDLFREFEQRTFSRFCTLRHQVFVFAFSKVVLSVLLLIACAAIMMGGGGLIFGVTWRHPLAVTLLTVSYCFFAAGFVTLLGSAFSSARQADPMCSLACMLVGIAGGSAFPSQQLPAFLRDHVSPLLPNNWFTETIRLLLFLDGPTPPWGWVALKTFLLGLVMIITASFLLRRKLQGGSHA